MGARKVCSPAFYSKQGQQWVQTRLVRALPSQGLKTCTCSLGPCPTAVMFSQRIPPTLRSSHNLASSNSCPWLLFSHHASLQQASSIYHLWCSPYSPWCRCPSLQPRWPMPSLLSPQALWAELLLVQQCPACVPQGWGFAFVRVGFHEVRVGLFPWAVLVPLDGNPVLWYTSCTPWFVVIQILDFKPKFSLNWKINLSIRGLY